MINVFFMLLTGGGVQPPPPPYFGYFVSGRGAPSRLQDLDLPLAIRTSEGTICNFNN